MSGFLLNTNVPSAVLQRSPDPVVEEWLIGHARESLYLSVVTMGEFEKGIALLPASARREFLLRAIEVLVPSWFGDRILPVTQPIAERWGRMAAERQLAGRPLAAADGLIAATAAEHGLVIVTRNVRDFDGLGVAVLNPWEG